MQVPRTTGGLPCGLASEDAAYAPLSCTHATVDRGGVSVDVSRSTRRLVASLPSYLFRISGSLARSLSTYLVDKRQDFALPICTADVLTPSRSLDSHPCPSHPSLGPSGEYLTVVVASRRGCSPVRTTFLSTRPWRVQKRHQVRAGVNKWRDIF